MKPVQGECGIEKNDLKEKKNKCAIRVRSIQWIIRSN